MFNKLNHGVVYFGLLVFSAAGFSMHGANEADIQENFLKNRVAIMPATKPFPTFHQFFELPEDLQAVVLSFTDKVTYDAFKKTCKDAHRIVWENHDGLVFKLGRVPQKSYLRNAMASYDFKCKKLEFEGMRSLTVTSTFQSILSALNNLHHVRHLKVSTLIGDMDGNMLALQQKPFWPHLETLEIDKVKMSPDTTDAVFSNLPSTLKVFHANRLTLTSKQFQALVKLPNLGELELTLVSPEVTSHPIVSFPSALKTFKYSSLYSEKKPTLSSFVQLSEGLQDLDLSFDSWDAVGLNDLRLPSTLQSFTLLGADLAGHIPELNLPENLKNLTIGIHGFEEADFQELSKKSLQNLEELTLLTVYLDGPRLVTDAPFQMVSRLPKLTSLEIRGVSTHDDPNIDLPRLPETLISLTLYKTWGTEKHFRQLGLPSGLKRLDLSHSPFGAMVKASDLPQGLECLNLEESFAEQETLQAIQEALPNLQTFLY